MTAIPNPFRSRVVANCSAPKAAAFQTRRSKQFVFKPTRGHTYSSTSIWINNGKNGLARSFQMNLVRFRFGQKMDLVGNQRVADGVRRCRAMFYCRDASDRRNARQPIATLISLGLGAGVRSMKYTR